MVTIFFLFCIFNIWGEHFSPYVAFTQNQSVLWSLATDEEYQNATLIAFDVGTQSVVEEITLPSELAVGMAYWSADQKHIAAVVGERRNPEDVGYRMFKAAMW